MGIKRCCDIDAGGGNAALMDTGKQTGQSAGQAGSEHIQALRGGERSGAAKETAVEHNHDADQEAVDALCARQSLQNQGLTEFVRIFRDQSGSGLTGDADTLCGTDTAKTYCEGSAQNC